MRTLRPILRVLPVAAAALLVAAAGAAQAKDVSFTFTGESDRAQHYFLVEGVEGKNPTLRVDPGDNVTITFAVGSGVHNLQIGEPIKEGTPILGADEGSRTVAFTVPESWSGRAIPYFCLPHKSVMAGEFRVSGEPTGEPERSTPAPGLAAAALAFASAWALASAFAAPRRPRD